jgi:hypothetical protein
MDGYRTDEADKARSAAFAEAAAMVEAEAQHVAKVALPLCRTLRDMKDIQAVIAMFSDLAARMKAKVRS